MQVPKPKKLIARPSMADASSKFPVILVGQIYNFSASGYTVNNEKRMEMYMLGIERLMHIVATVIITGIFIDHINQKVFLTAVCFVAAINKFIFFSYYSSK